VLKDHDRLKVVGVKPKHVVDAIEDNHLFFSIITAIA
jgi:hypothetical protein